MTIREDELIALIHEQDIRSYEYLYENYKDKIYGAICVIVLDKHKAEDALQETFIKIWKSFSSYDAGKGRLFTWMINIARNTALDSLRRKGEVMRSKTDSGHFEYAMRSGSHTYEPKVEQIGISSLIAQLKPGDRTIVTLIYYNGYTQAQVAMMLDMPLGTIKTRLRQSIRHLRRIFAQ